MDDCTDFRLKTGASYPSGVEESIAEERTVWSGIAYDRTSSHRRIRQRAALNIQPRPARLVESQSSVPAVTKKEKLLP